MPSWPEKAHAPTKEETPLLKQSVGVCVAEEGGVNVVGVPIGTVEYVRTSLSARWGRQWKEAMIVLRAAPLTSPDKQAVALIAIESLGQ